MGSLFDIKVTSLASAFFHHTQGEEIRFGSCQGRYTFIAIGRLLIVASRVDFPKTIFLKYKAPPFPLPIRYVHIFPNKVIYFHPRVIRCSEAVRIEPFRVPHVSLALTRSSFLLTHENYRTISIDENHPILSQYYDLLDHYFRQNHRGSLYCSYRSDGIVVAEAIGKSLVAVIIPVIGTKSLEFDRGARVLRVAVGTN